MTWADKNYSLADDTRWIMRLTSDLRDEIRAERFGEEFTDAVATLACAKEFTRSDTLRRRCAEALREAEHARAVSLREMPA